MRLTITVILVAFSLAQPLGADEFEHLRTEDGLSNASVQAVFKDSRGFLWIGTQNGLNKFDGYDITIYKHDPLDSTSISGKAIYCIYEDSENRLWIGTSGDGLNLYQPEKDNFISYEHDPDEEQSLSHNWVTSIYEDRTGRLWVGTQNGINLYNSENNTFNRFLTNLVESTDPSDLRLSTIFDIAEDIHGNLWIPTWSGLIMFNPENGKHFHYKKSLKNSFLKIDSVQSIYIDENNIMWIGAFKGPLHKIFLEYHRDTVLLNGSYYYLGADDESALSDNRINRIISDNDDNLWIATEYGLNYFDKSTEKFTKYYSFPNNPGSLSSNIINNLFFDEQDILWIATRDNGVDKFDKRQRKFDAGFPFINQTQVSDIRFVKSVYEEKNGKIWVGTDYGLLEYSSDAELLRTYTYESDNKQGIGLGGVSGLLEDSLGNLWISTWGEGLSVFDRKKKIFTKYSNIGESNFSPEHPGDNDIRTIIKDKEGMFWYGTTRGFLDSFNPYTRKFSHYFIYDVDSLRGVPVVTIAAQNDGTVWAGAIPNGGLIKIDKETGKIKRYHSEKALEKGLITNEINALFVDRKDRLWLGTDVGLMLYNSEDESFSRILGRNNELKDVPIVYIFEDKDDYLWLSTPFNTYRFDYEETSMVTFDDTDGMISPISTSFVTENGKVYVGGMQGLLDFYPQDIDFNLQPPPVVITEFQINNKPVEIGTENSPLNLDINSTKEIRLNHNQSFFSFQYSALNFSQVEKNQYAYMLEGFDSWNYVGQRRTAYYTNIPPGTYTFRVIASNNDGVWNTIGKSVEIVVDPPWYRTIVAFAIYLFLIIAGMYYIIRFTMKREKLKSELLLKEIELQKQQELAVKENEVSSAKLKFYTNITHEFRTPLTLIISPIGDVLSNSEITYDLRRPLEIARKNAKRLLRLINQVLDFTKIEAGFMRLEVSKANVSVTIENIIDSFSIRAKRKRIEYHINNPLSNFMGYIDIDKLEKILYNLISNAFKFTEENGSVFVEVKYFNDSGEVNTEETKTKIKYIEFLISNTGEGISQEDMGQIFNRFYHIHADSGTGIGLSVVKSLTELHMGEIRVWSTPNELTTFKVRLPVYREAFPEESIIDDRNTERLTYSSYHLTKEAELLTDIPVIDNELENTSGLPIMLVVEDEIDLRQYIATIFPEFKVITAKDGIMGLKLADELIPDIIISDVMMPEMDGMEMTRELKSRQTTSHIPVIILTAKVSKQDVMGGLESGADDYIFKPFEGDELRMKVLNQIETRKKYAEQLISRPDDTIARKSYNSTDREFLDKLEGIVNDFMSDPNFSNKDLCDKIGMSRAQLYRKVKNLTGKSVHEYIKIMRMNRASKLFLDKGLRISEVMEKVGFKSHSYFTKCFKDYFGFIPSDYLKKQN